MKNSFIALVVLFALVDTGNSLQCYSCKSQDGQLYSPHQCNHYQVIESCIDGNFTCSNYRNKTIKNNETIEVQVKGCLLKDECMSRKARCSETASNGGECESLCCDQKLCNNDFDEDPVLECYHCDGPFPNGSLGFNSSSSLNQSYGTHQCVKESEIVPCPNGLCSRFYRRFKNENNIDVEVEIRSCLPISMCSEIDRFCRLNEMNSNNTLCKVLCCERPALCNIASRGDLIPFFIALVGFAAWQL